MSLFSFLRKKPKAVEQEQAPEFERKVIVYEIPKDKREELARLQDAAGRVGSGRLERYRLWSFVTSLLTGAKIYGKTSRRKSSGQLPPRPLYKWSLMSG